MARAISGGEYGTKSLALEVEGFRDSGLGV